MKRYFFAIVCLAACLIVLIGAVPAAAQDGNRVQLIDIDTSQFPLVTLTLMTADEVGAPVADLSQLTLRENGSPVAEISYDSVPAGIDVTFVLDANVGFDEVDDEDNLTRREKVRDSIRHFAEEYMDADGQDRVSIMVPSADGQSASWLLQDATEPAAVIAAIDGYNPSPLRPTPLNAMLQEALDTLLLQADPSRYHAMLLFTDSRRLPEQLSFPLLTAVANDSNTPVYVAILGASADEQEIANARRLFEPTSATYVHMPGSTDAGPIYQIWQDQSDHLLLTYQSRQRQNGQNQINISLGSAVASGSFDLEFLPPDVTLQEAELEINRAGATADSLLQELQPAVQALPLEISWPDGMVRSINDVSLTVNGQDANLEGFSEVERGQIYTLNWDISDLDQGSYDLQLTVTDELGYQGTSDVVPLTIGVTRPPAAGQPEVGPTPESDRNAAEEPQERETAAFRLPSVSIPLPDGDAAAAVTGLALFFLVAIFWRNRGRQAYGGGHSKTVVPMPPPPPAEKHREEVEEVNLVARLEPFASGNMELVEFVGDNITIGRTSGLANIVIPHPSLGQLHARIRHQNDNYWLFDEGSSEGTHLNYERLGLAPRKLEDGDVVQFGRVSYRFRLRPEGDQVAANGAAASEPEHVVIFDMDGLMVDTEPLSRQAWDVVLEELGCEPLSDSLYESILGHRLWETSELLVNQYQIAIEPSELAWRKEVQFAELRSAGIAAMPGLFELLSALRQRHIPWGVATSSPRHLAEEILAQINVLDSCRFVAAGDEVVEGKPEPDVYLLAAERFNVDPRKCLAIEDSVPGTRAAKAAGMLTIAIPNSRAMWDNFEAADHIMTSLRDVAGRLDELLDELSRR